jgi:hypothetical protein
MTIDEFLATEASEDVKQIPPTHAWLMPSDLRVGIRINWRASADGRV